MAVNDRILIDGVIDDRLARGIPSGERDEVFEFFAFEQLLKFADLSSDELKAGWIDGENDGGIDGFFLFVNGHLLSDLASLQWIRSGADIRVCVVTCKHHDTFKQAVADKLVATLIDLLDFGRSSSDLVGRYSPALLVVRDRLIAAYRTLATRIDNFVVRMYYASRGDTDNIGTAVRLRANQAEEIIRGFFSSSSVRFEFVGASELIALSRRSRRYSLELPFVECFEHRDRYVLLTRLEDYARFVRDDEGETRRYLFDSNVRDYVGMNRVNEDIAQSLADMGGPDFWWLNNGITILATKAIITGKAIVLDDVQIVNGLQTTESIARFFTTGGVDPSERSVLVKIIKTDDPAVRDAIIRATNNQTAVEQQSLHATDKTQRDIEEVLLRAGWYYDRRKNYYANQGHPLERIVTPLYLAAGSVALFLRSPSAASRLKQRAMRRPAAYDTMFSTDIDLAAWPRLVEVLKFVDAQLVNYRLELGGTGERFLKRWRYLMALLLTARIAGRFSFSSRDLAGADLSSLSDDWAREAWDLVRSHLPTASEEPRKHLPKGFVRDVCREAADRWQLKGVASVERRQLDTAELVTPGSLSDDFLNLVDTYLPAQPWKPGIDRLVAERLHCSRSRVIAATQELITRGRRNRQKDGVVFDREGKIIDFDPDRVSGPVVIGETPQ